MPMRTILVILAAAGLAACDSMDLTIAVNEVEDGWLEVINSNDRALTRALVVVETFESAGATRLCVEETWHAGSPVL